MIETHTQRMYRLLHKNKIDSKCRVEHLTFGNRCVNCGYTPENHKATLFSPRLDKAYD